MSTRPGGERGRTGPLTANVADGDAPACLVDDEGVVEIAAHLLALHGGPVPRGHSHPLDGRERPGQEAVLKRARDIPGDLEEPGVVDREGRPPGQVLGQHEVVFVEAWRVLHPQKREHAEHAPACDEGYDDGRVVAQPAHEGEMLVALRDLALEAG